MYWVQVYLARMRKYEKNMQVGIAQLMGRNNRKQKSLSRGGNPRVEQHAGQQISVLECFHHEEIPLDIARGQNEV